MTHGLLPVNRLVGKPPTRPGEPFPLNSSQTETLLPIRPSCPTPSYICCTRSSGLGMDHRRLRSRVAQDRRQAANVPGARLRIARRTSVAQPAGPRRRGPAATAPPPPPHRPAGRTGPAYSWLSLAAASIILTSASRRSPNAFSERSFTCRIFFPVPSSSPSGSSRSTPRMNMSETHFV